MWHGLLKIIEINHLDQNGNIIWQKKDLKNILHHQGEAFILNVTFVDQTSVPAKFYFGLDNRPGPNALDTLASIYNEPTTNTGYQRISVGSSGQFVLSTDPTTHISTATSPIISFTAQTTSYTVSNLFLATTSDSSGLLISTVQFGSVLTVAAGESVNMRMSLSLTTC